MTETIISGAYQVMPSMPAEQFEALKADILERGILTPIDIDEKGVVLDGHHRLKACQELGITQYPTIIRPGLTEEEKRMFARKSNMMRRHLDRKQIQAIIKYQLIDTPNWADNRIGKELGVDGKTVKAIRKKLEATSEIPKLDKLIGSDGKERPLKKPSIMTASEEERDRMLKNLSDAGFDISKLPKGFIESSSGHIFCDYGYDPFYGLNDEQINEWKIFQEYLLNGRKNRDAIQNISSHIEWLRNKDFKTPTEWLGKEGQEYRRRWGMKIGLKVQKHWEEHLEKQLASGKKFEFINNELQ